MPEATKTKPTPTHPPVATMVVDAIKDLKDRKGSSLIAIKKYISDNNTCDVVRLAPFIRRFLKKAVEDGKLLQIKASYKLSPASKAEKPKKPAAKKSPKKTVTKTATKKPAAENPKKKSDKSKKPKTPKTSEKTPKKVKTPKKAATKAKKAKSPAKKAAKPKKTPKKTTKKPAKK